MTGDLFDVEAAEAASSGDRQVAALVLRVHLQPGAGPSAVTGRRGDALGVRVAPPPKDPRAAAAAASFLAELLALEPGQLEPVEPLRPPLLRFRLRGIGATALRRQLDEALAGAGRADRGARPGRSGR